MEMEMVDWFTWWHKCDMKGLYEAVDNNSQ